MITIQDVLGHIATELRGYSGRDRAAAIEELLAGLTFEVHMAITADVTASALDFAQRYGQGRTFRFGLADYAHGKELAGQMYHILSGRPPDLGGHTGAQPAPAAPLYLLVHLSNISPSFPE